MPQLGAPELIIILVIILLLFGVGRLGKVGGELGSGIRAFREGLKTPDEDPVKSIDEAETAVQADEKAEDQPVTQDEQKPE
jgi:sec-independent protein translocase protein TatA